MGLTNLKTVEGMNSEFDRLWKQLGQVAALSKAAYMNREAARPKGLSAQTAESFGKALKGIRRGADGELKELGVGRGDIALDLKAPLGSGELRGDATTGSYLIPQEMATEVLRIAEERSELMGLVRRTPMTSRTKLFPRKLVGPDFTYLTSEATDKTEGSMTFDQVTLTAAVFALWVSCSEEFVEDNTLGDFGAFFAEMVGEAWSRCFDSQFLTGTGSPTTGVLNNANCNIYTMAGGKNSFLNVEFDDLWSVVGKLTSKAQRSGARWIMHPTILDLFCKIKDAQGNYIAQRPTEALPGRLLSYPIVLSDQAPEVADDAKSTGFVAFGNPNCLLHGERIGLEIKYFPDTHYGAISDQVFFRARVRSAHSVALPSGFAVLKTAA